MKYNHLKIEPKWQKVWAKNKYKNWQSQDFSKKPKKYVLDMFPYPSGDGLHVGHLEGYVATDIYSRYLRMTNHNVVHPMGWDAFGLPAENYAIKTNTHPEQVVEKNVKNFKRQIQSFGLSYDWSKEINTTDPEYYKWTQWIFLQLFKAGLAYEDYKPINFCPSCKTGLANEEVIDNKCARCNSVVEKKKLRQWMLKITDYADKLLEGLDKLDWPQSVKDLQRNWIGRSEGAHIKFKVQSDVGRIGEIEVFTTRPDTLFGATYLVLSPEHPLISQWKVHVTNHSEVERYADAAFQKTEEERTDPQKSKTGVELHGIEAINPANNRPIPIWISDYVLMGYGTGAIMAVPAHDTRDFEFAKKFNLEIIQVIKPEKEIVGMDEIYTGNGTLINSGNFSGLNNEIAKEKICLYTSSKKTVAYHLRDWVFSRQRYWGEPIPIIKCEKCGNVPLKEKDLPLKLPKVKSYQPSGTGESPLASIEKWVNTKCPKCGGPAKRETNTMPQWAGSCWYYLRYIDPKNKKAFIDAKKEKYWMPVDLYVGGAEHAVLHLLYARFWHKFLYDQKLLTSNEPFKKLINQGIILGDNREKMSKSKGNVVNPDEIIKEYGADTLRMYEMFMGPLETMKPWDAAGISGVNRFLNRIWNLISEQIKATNWKKIKDNAKQRKALHQAIKRATKDIENLSFNTAISGMMECLNVFTEKEESDSLAMPQVKKEYLEDFLKILAPFAPHITEELWQMLGHKKSIHLEKWPKYNEKFLIEKDFELIVQINGKVRDRIKSPIDISQDNAEKLVMKQEKIKQFLNGQTPKKIIFIKNRLINIVI
ncbi:MAG TPA: leucine--tRNA ligase [Candidatus Paceibacterota bacterium]|nr:leucine--tRNA ligase [Candidatus Paceibacterota bacterium]HPT40128.1 leucine--tRNA ligase [Candidatus Paceibacterota bacterium]